MRLIALCLLLTATQVSAATPAPAAPTAAQATPATSSTVDFELRDPKTKEVYFTGSEKTSQDGKAILKETLYFDAAKKEVQKDSFSFEAASLRPIDFSSSNSLTGEFSKIVPNEAQGLQIEYRPSLEAKTGSGVVKSDARTYLASAAGDLILQNWDHLVAGKAIKFELVVPSRLESIPFQLVRRETLTVDNESREVFTLMPQNILIRMLAPHLEFQFNKDKKIKQAVFPSSLPIKGAKDRMVEMVFKT